MQKLTKLITVLSPINSTKTSSPHKYDDHIEVSQIFKDHKEKVAEVESLVDDKCLDDDKINSILSDSKTSCDKAAVILQERSKKHNEIEILISKCQGERKRT